MSNSPFVSATSPLQGDGYEATLKRVRKRWWLWSALPIAAALAVIFFIFYTLAWNALGAKAFAADSYGSSIDRFSKNDRWLPSQQWIVQYNLGTARVGIGAYSSGITWLEHAKELAPPAEPDADYSQADPANLPPMCLINGNMAVAYSLIGQDFATEGQPFLEEFRQVVAQIGLASTEAQYNELKDSLKPIADQGIPLFEQAIEAFDEAIQLRAEFACPDPDNITEELTKAKQAAQDAIDEMTDPDLPPPPSEDESESSPEQEEQPADPDQEPGQGESEEPEGGQGNEESPAEPDPNGGSGSTLTPGETDRREQLNERNKAGQEERDSTESYMKGYEYTRKNW